MHLVVVAESVGGTAKPQLGTYLQEAAPTQPQPMALILPSPAPAAVLVEDGFNCDKDWWCLGLRPGRSVYTTQNSERQSLCTQGAHVLFLFRSVAGITRMMPPCLPRPPQPAVAVDGVKAVEEAPLRRPTGVGLEPALGC